MRGAPRSVLYIYNITVFKSSVDYLCFVVSGASAPQLNFHKSTKIASRALTYYSSPADTYIVPFPLF